MKTMAIDKKKLKKLKFKKMAKNIFEKMEMEEDEGKETSRPIAMKKKK